MKIKIIILSLAVAFVSCKDYKSELDQSNRERDSLFNIIDARDSSINDFLQSYNEIQTNLDSIARKGNTIAKSMDNEGQVKSSRERINDNIAAINALLDENRTKIADLNRKLKNSGNKNAKLQKMIEDLNTRIMDKDRELAELNEKLNNLNANVIQLQTNIDTLTAVNTSQAQTISDQTVALHTAFYKIGTSRELQDMKIINKEGGMLGIGKSSKLTDNIDNSKFTQIDYTQMTTIPVNGNNIKIITSHSVNSYALDKEGKNKVTNLRITNPDLFWSASKYLVIVKD
jgi:peptidoglycan hydrolase CwlO-like protein